MKYLNYIVVFILFRFFDIIKPWPIRFMEQLPKGLGVMCDDLTAGLITLILIQIINFYLF